MMRDGSQEQDTYLAVLGFYKFMLQERQGTRDTLASTLYEMVKAAEHFLRQADMLPLSNEVRMLLAIQALSQASVMVLIV